MTSLGNHHIRSLIFQLSIPDRENAKNIQDRFSAFAEAEIPQLMEQVLDKYDRPGQVIRMDRLEIDLGDIQTKDRDHGMREEFFRQLERALHDRLKSGSIENGGVSIAKVSNDSHGTTGTFSPLRLSTLARRSRGFLLPG